MMPPIFAVIGAVGFYKLGQALFDEDYEGSAVPAQVREKKIRNHVGLYGYYCSRCGRRRTNLEVDHIIPLARGGRNSWYNLQVFCGDCNRQKGATHTFWEGFRGRTK